MTRVGDWMQTVTGRKFWPMDPRPEDVDIIDIAHALSMICRFGGHCLRFYSVAEHSVLIARKAPPEYQLAALLHDASEAYLSDIVRPLKRSLPEYRLAEDRVQHAIRLRFSLGYVGGQCVKQLDRAILADERAQNMEPTDEVWSIGEGPLGVTLQFWSPERARDEFLDCYDQVRNR